MSPAVRRRIAQARTGYFATSDGRRPSLVPVTFVLLGDTIYHALDAKPKARPATRLRRVANLRINPHAAFLTDHYDDEDWNRLWYVLVRGRARLIDQGDEHRRAIAALRRKYPPYRTTVPLSSDAPVIALDVEVVRAWTSARRRRGSAADRRV